MSKKDKNQNPNNVVAFLARCPVENCCHKAERSAFCNEHFHWFKQGLVNRKGEKPKDFDRKYQAYIKKQAA